MDELNAYCPIRVTHEGTLRVFGEITAFVAVGGSVSFDLVFPNRVAVRLQPCASDYAVRVEYALSLGGHRRTHPNVPVMTIEGQCIRLRSFFGAFPFTRSNFMQCGVGVDVGVGAARSSAISGAVPAVVVAPRRELPDVRVPRDMMVRVVGRRASVESESDDDELLAALDEFRATVLANAAECVRTRDVRIAQLRAERDRLLTWVIPDALCVLTEVILRPISPSVLSCKWTPIRGILLPALEQYARQCTGMPSLVLKAAFAYSDVTREEEYIDACSRLGGSVAHLPRTWPCGDGQYLMWRADGCDGGYGGDGADGEDGAWKRDALCIDAGVDIPVHPARMGVSVSVCPPIGSKSAIIVRVALGRCAHSPSNATHAHQSAKCGESTYIVFDAARVIPAFRVAFF